MSALWRYRSRRIALARSQPKDQTQLIERLRTILSGDPQRFVAALRQLQEPYMGADAQALLDGTVLREAAEFCGINLATWSKYVLQEYT